MLERFAKSHWQLDQSFGGGRQGSTQGCRSQWRTAQDKAVLDLFGRRHEVFLVIRLAVHRLVSSSPGFDQARETEFLEMMERAYCFFDDDVQEYLKRLWKDILDVRTADTEMKGGNLSHVDLKQAIDNRQAAFNRIACRCRCGMCAG